MILSPISAAVITWLSVLQVSRLVANLGICLKMSFDYNYQNALRQVIVFGILCV